MRKNDNQKLNITDKESTTIYCLSLFFIIAFSYFLFLIPEGNDQTLFNYTLTQLGYLITPIVYLKLKGYSYSNVIPIKGKVKPIGLLLTIPITIGSFMQNTILSVLFNNFIMLFGVTPSVLLPLTDTPLNIVLALISVIILPAFAEEFLFRGVFTSAYENHGVIKACALSGLIFALSHFNPAQIAHQFVLGFILSATVLTTGSIWYAVVIHFINNVLALFIGDIIPAYNSLAVLNGTNILILLAMCVVGAVILIVSFIFFNRTCAKDNLKIKGNPIKVLSKKKCPAYYENSSGSKLSYITIGFIAFLIVMSILTPVIESIPL